MSYDRHIHVYDESATVHFCDKLETFHEQSCNGMAMWGHAKHGTDLESIPMHINKRLATDKLAKKLVGAFLNLPANLVVKLEQDGKSSLEMLYYEFNKKVYLVQIVTNFPKLDRFTLEVFPIECELTIPYINLFWIL